MKPRSRTFKKAPPSGLTVKKGFTPNPKKGISFPSAWLWLVDQSIPDFVKTEYSPKESWKGKPFSREDAFFFFKGIEELSEKFTEERSKGIPAYFQHAKFRSGYLLYFLPLQAAKFLSLFDMHASAMEAVLADGRKRGKIRIGDLGSGPGTASIAALLWLLEWSLRNKAELPPIELVWLDTNLSTMRDGQTLVEKLASSFPKLRGKVTVIRHVAPWWDVTQLRGEAPFSLMLLGHILNEASGPQPHDEDEGRHEKWRKLWSTLIGMTSGGGVLLIEPASRKTAQQLSLQRDHFLSSELVNASATSIWGPCLHAGKCPLAEGRDWCHFSVPVDIPGKWFRHFSIGLGSERNWLKFSYLWIASKDYPSAMPASTSRRVISDPIGTDKAFVLICEPETPGRFPLRPKQRIFRGETVRL